MINDIKKEADQRMHRGVDALKEEMRKLRTGRAHAGLLEHVMVEYYGTNVPIKQTASISVEDARTLVVTPWEKNIVAAVEKALVTLDIKTGDTKKTQEDSKVVVTEIEAYARELTIRITIERVTDKATRVIVDASKKYVIKDAATAGEILNQTTNNLPRKS